MLLNFEEINFKRQLVRKFDITKSAIFFVFDSVYTYVFADKYLEISQYDNTLFFICLIFRFQKVVCFLPSTPVLFFSIDIIGTISISNRLPVINCLVVWLIDFARKWVTESVSGQGMFATFLFTLRLGHCSGKCVIYVWAEAILSHLSMGSHGRIRLWYN